MNAEFFCTSCRTPFQNGFPLDSQGRCAVCRSGFRGFDAAYSYGFYESFLRKLIHLFKYTGMRPLAKPLGEFLADALPRTEEFDVITTVPLHWRRRWQRSFNQSELLARALSRRVGKPAGSFLRRVRATSTQAGLSNSARRRNVAAAFVCTRPKSVAGRRILLIDDVMTTGSTAASCALTLKRAGAKRVVLLTVARVDRRTGRSDVAKISVGGTT